MNLMNGRGAVFFLNVTYQTSYCMFVPFYVSSTWSVVDLTLGIPVLILEDFYMFFADVQNESQWRFLVEDSYKFITSAYLRSV